jgi:hypothetical protein
VDGWNSYIFKSEELVASIGTNGAGVSEKFLKRSRLRCIGVLLHGCCVCYWAGGVLHGVNIGHAGTTGSIAALRAGVLTVPGLNRPKKEAIALDPRFCDGAARLRRGWWATRRHQLQGAGRLRDAVLLRRQNGRAARARGSTTGDGVFTGIASPTGRGAVASALGRAWEVRSNIRPYAAVGAWGPPKC